MPDVSYLNYVTSFHFIPMYFIAFFVCLTYVITYCTWYILGVGFAAKPVPRTLLPDDVVRIEIEHIGTLENNVRE